MIYRAYRFTDEAEARPLIDAGGHVAVDEIGIAYAEATEGEEPAALPGFFVNAVWQDAEPEGWATARIDAADAPRWWSGVPRIEPSPAPVAVPQIISPLQARRVLRTVGLLDQVDAWLAIQPPGVRDAWEYAIEVRRDDQEVVAPAAAALGLTDQEVDALFIMGAAL